MKDFTGYWTFFSNPAKWAIDDFLASGEVYLTFTVTEWHKDFFQKGQLGVIRVGHDKRTKEQLKGKKRLERGIYAVVEILSKAEERKAPDSPYWLEEDEAHKERYRVKMRIIKNLLGRSIPLDSEIFRDENNKDTHLINGVQVSSMPLNPDAFKAIVDSTGGSETLDYDFIGTDSDSIDAIEKLNREYLGAVPEVKERMSRYIERGKIANEYKKRAGFKCQICDAMGRHPYVFRKPNGDYYIEAHHVIPVSELAAGSLAINNLLAVCPNHHRQLHYGSAEVIENNADYFVFNIDDQTIQVRKLKFAAETEPSV